MKHLLLGFFLLVAGIGSALLLLDSAALDSVAQVELVDSEPPENSSVTAVPESHSGKEEAHDFYSGVWREGKAVFSDWVALDFLLKDYLKRGYAPEQPIKYSHKLHAGKLGIECQYCHSGVAKSPYATLPSVELCMGCHATVKTDSPEIKKLAKHFKEKKPIEWVPVNNLPEHAQFNHKRHVKAGVSCQNCHGLVQEMEVVEKVSSLKMGWCVSCHRDNGASIDCAVCHY